MTHAFLSGCQLVMLQAVRNKHLEAKPSDKPKQVNLLDLDAPDPLLCFGLPACDVAGCAQQEPGG
jgi:hypothetical protein